MEGFNRREVLSVCELLTRNLRKLIRYLGRMLGRHWAHAHSIIHQLHMHNWIRKPIWPCKVKLRCYHSVGRILCQLIFPYNGAESFSKVNTELWKIYNTSRFVLAFDSFTNPSMITANCSEFTTHIYESCKGCYLWFRPRLHPPTFQSRLQCRRALLLSHSGTAGASVVLCCPEDTHLLQLHNHLLEIFISHPPLSTW